MTDSNRDATAAWHAAFGRAKHEYWCGLALCVGGAVVLWALAAVQGSDGGAVPAAQSVGKLLKLQSSSDIPQQAAIIWSLFTVHWAIVAWRLQGVNVRPIDSGPAGKRGADWEPAEVAESATRQGLEEIGALLVIVLAVRGHTWTGSVFLLLAWMIAAAALAYGLIAWERLRGRLGGMLWVFELLAFAAAVRVGMELTGLASLRSPTTAWFILWSAVSYLAVRSLERDGARGMLLIAMPAAIIMGEALGFDAVENGRSAAQWLILVLSPASVAAAFLVARSGGMQRPPFSGSD